MIKSVIKEIIIIFLLIIAILLILGVMLYEYMPMSKTIPSAVEEYILPQEIQTELADTVKEAETQNIIKTYRIDSSDLNRYIRTGDYDQGKINPFSPAEVKNTGEGLTDNNTTNTNNNTSDSNNGKTDTSGKFFNTSK